MAEEKLETRVDRLRARLRAELEASEAALDALRTELRGDVVPKEVHDQGWQWRPVTQDTAFASPFGDIRVCVGCRCLVAGGPTACNRCAGSLEPSRDEPRSFEFRWECSDRVYPSSDKIRVLSLFEAGGGVAILCVENNEEERDRRRGHARVVLSPEDMDALCRAWLRWRGSEFKKSGDDCRDRSQGGEP